MPTLSTQDLITLWERGPGRSPLERALDLLTVARPHAPREELARLPIGRRDAELLRLREATFGPALAGYAECPRCGERLEFELDTRALGSGADPADPSGEHLLEQGEYRVRFRLPTSLDLESPDLESPDLEAAADDPDRARRRVLARCVLACSAAGRPLKVDALPAAVLAAVESEMAALDPAAEVSLALACPACDHRWSLPLDIAAFFWTEVSVRARRLLHEVHALARAYGWREADILAMSAARRHAYLELLA